MESLKKARWFDDERILTEMALLKMARLSHTLPISDSLAALAKGQPQDPSPSPSKGGAPGPADGRPAKGDEKGRGSASKKGSPPPKGTASKKATARNEAVKYYRRFLRERAGKSTRKEEVRRRIRKLEGPTKDASVLPGGASTVA